MIRRVLLAIPAALILSAPLAHADEALCFPIVKVGYAHSVNQQLSLLADCFSLSGCFRLSGSLSLNDTELKLKANLTLGQHFPIGEEPYRTTAGEYMTCRSRCRA